MSEPHLTRSYQDRFGGISRLYGLSAQQRLQQATVAIAGVGGVGSWAAEALARSGIGHIVLIDLDDICISNINRQIHTLTDTVGQMKAGVMAERIRSINPECRVDCIEDFLTPDNISTLISGSWDYVIDAIDSVRPKAALINYCRRNRIPLVATGGAGGQTDPMAIVSGDLSRTIQDPLAKKVRQILRKEYGFSSDPKKKFAVPCIYSTEPLKYPQPDGSVCASRSPESTGGRLNCAGGFGASVMVTGTFGFMAAACAVNHIAGKD